MTENGPDINFDYFAIEDGWALAPLRVLLFDEYRRSIDSLGNPNLDKTPRDTVSLIAQFDRHMRAAQRRGDIVAIDHTKDAFAGGGLVEPIFRSQDLLRELKFRGYPVPDRLIDAIKNGDWPTVVKLLKEFQRNMKAFIANGGKFVGESTAHQIHCSDTAKARVEGLVVWNDVEVMMKQPNKNPVAYPASILGFNSIKTEEWKALLGILRDGKFSYTSDEASKKQMYMRIEKKLIKFFNKQLDLSLPDDFKVFTSVPGGEGVRKPVFKTQPTKTKPDIDYSEYDKEKILEEIGELAISNNTESASTLSLAVGHAEKLGIGSEEISDVLDRRGPGGNLQPSHTQDPDNICGTKINTSRDYDGDSDPDMTSDTWTDYK